MKSLHSYPITYGMPEWYKEELLKAALNEQEPVLVGRSESEQAADPTEAKT